ncbi:MAG: ABC transporter substrate-binding protein [Christensenellaceae bacterium]|jgi:peptide/nickel transport system substrate-binding protein|nr:ABC transporter substrate-binding protein [Christensenellaceae bacterium]
MKHITKTIALLLCTLMLLGLAACGGGNTTSPSTPAANAPAGSGSDAAPASYQDTIIIGVANDVTTLDPQGSNTDSNMMVFALTHDTIVEIDPDTGEIIPGLATEWSMSSDGCVFSFTIPAGVTFTDGTPLTTNDIKYTYERAAESSFTKTKVDLITGINVVDDTHIEITISKPSQEFLTLLAHRSMSILSEALVKADEFGYQVGSGVFAVDEWIPGDQISFLRNDGYRGTIAPTRSIIFRLIKEESSRLVALQTGEIDVCIDPLVTDLGYIEDDSNLELIKVPNVVMLYIAINNKKPGLDNVNVRKAIAYATNKEAMIIAGYNGEGTVHNNFINRGQFGLYEDLPVYEYDLDKAKAALAASGYAEGQLKFNVIYNGSAKENIALVLQEDLSKIGINLELSKLETAALKGILNDAALDYELCLYQWTDADGTDFTVRNMYGSSEQGGKLVKNGSNRAVLEDAVLNKMIDDALVELDTAKREQMYYDIELYLNEIMPVVPICTSMINIGVKKGLDGVKWVGTAKHDYRYIALPEA